MKKSDLIILMRTVYNGDVQLSQNDPGCSIFTEGFNHKSETHVDDTAILEKWRVFPEFDLFGPLVALLHLTDTYMTCGQCGDSPRDCLNPCLHPALDPCKSLR